MDRLSAHRADRLRSYLVEQRQRLRRKEADLMASVFADLREAEKHKTPSPVRRCVASVINKETGETRDDDEVSDKEKSRAFAVCWANYNKGRLSKGFGGKKGKEREAQYKALLKKK